MDPNQDVNWGDANPNASLLCQRRIMFFPFDSCNHYEIPWVTIPEESDGIVGCEEVDSGVAMYACCMSCSSPSCAFVDGLSSGREGETAQSTQIRCLRNF